MLVIICSIYSFRLRISPSIKWQIECIENVAQMSASIFGKDNSAVQQHSLLSIHVPGTVQVPQEGQVCTKFGPSDCWMVRQFLSGMWIGVIEGPACIKVKHSNHTITMSRTGISTYMPQSFPGRSTRDLQLFFLGPPQSWDILQESQTVGF